MTEPSMTCAVCGGTWGKPNPVLARWRICPADCHDEEKWKALEDVIDSNEVHERAFQLGLKCVELESEDRILRTRIAELEKQNAALATDVAAYRHLHSEAGI